MQISVDGLDCKCRNCPRHGGVASQVGMPPRLAPVPRGERHHISLWPIGYPSARLTVSAHPCTVRQWYPYEKSQGQVKYDTVDSRTRIELYCGHYNANKSHEYLFSMYADITKPPAPPPLREVTIISLGILLLQPLSRRGSGPGLILVTENSENILKIADGVPSVFMKWAEEGYAVVQISVADLQTGRRLGDAVAEAATTLERCEKCLDGNFGLIGTTYAITQIFSKR